MKRWNKLLPRDIENYEEEAELNEIDDMFN